jgi:hypothetical protein
MVTVMLLLSGAAGSAENAGGALGSTWADAARMPDLFTGMWMTLTPMVEADAKRDVPYTAKARKYVDSCKFKRDIPYAEEGCATPGLPIAMGNYTHIRKGKSELGPFSGEPEEWVCTVSVTSFDPDSNTYKDKDPEEMVKYLDKLGR